MPKTPRTADICCRPEEATSQVTQPHSAPLVTSSVWRCESPEQADRLLQGTLDGYVYQRDRHPNADVLLAKCAELHGTERAALTSCGMSALSLALLSQLQPGDHVIVSSHLYGRSRQLFHDEGGRWGLKCSIADTSDLAQVRKAVTERTRMLVVETISNPLLRVADIPSLAEIAHQAKATLLVDNTFATPVVCQPSRWGADWVHESITKMMNGHSDVMLGLLCGPQRLWDRMAATMSIWGLTSSPFDCWMALRGLATLDVRMERACANALRVAEMLAGNAAVERVDYPGLRQHLDHGLASKLFHGKFGSIVTFHLRGGRPAADQFIRELQGIPFCPSLGEVSTTVSHPESTSHRGVSAAERQSLGISGGTIRLSVGIESSEHISEMLLEGLRRVAV